jgi:hypothetical protein
LGYDFEGVGECLNETESITHDLAPIRLGKPLVITGTHRLLVGMQRDASSLYRPLAHNIHYAPLVAFNSLAGNDLSKSVPAWLTAHPQPQFSGVAVNLPDNVALMTLQPLRRGVARLRLSHLFAADEDATLSQAASVNITRIFSRGSIQVKDIVAKSLTGNQNASVLEVYQQSQMWRLRAQARNTTIGHFEATSAIKAQLIRAELDTAQVVSVTAMDVRTFEITLS